MVYQICYTPKDAKPGSRGVCMFDIEYHMKQSEKDKEKWYSELHCLPCVDGLCYFINDKAKDKDFNIDQFVKDATEIQEIRGFLYERNDNRPKEYEEANEFHYHKFRKAFEDILNNFKYKYDLWINVD